MSAVRRLCAALLLGAAACTPGTGDAPVGERRPATTRHPPLDSTTTITTETSTTTTTTTTSVVIATAPPVPFHAFVVGDFGAGTVAEEEVAAAMAQAAGATPPAALITTGDNLYGSDVEQRWYEPFSWLVEASVEVWISWGNHDIETRDRIAVVQEVFDPPGRWYVERLGDAVVVLLDANQPRDEEQLAWLEEVLERHASDLVIAAFHQPAFSCSTHGSSPAIQQAWVPLFEARGVDLVLNGHDHNYQRFGRNGVTYVVTGGGGAGLYPVGACPRGTPQPVTFDDNDHHFLVLTVVTDSIRVVALAADGAVLDSFVVENQPHIPEP